tara:strand:- start:273 stop:380 length:108 start_codon:yes stop_codon:yes gene_type:complete
MNHPTTNAYPRRSGNQENEEEDDVDWLRVQPNTSR